MIQPISAMRLSNNFYSNKQTSFKGFYDPTCPHITEDIKLSLERMNARRNMSMYEKIAEKVKPALNNIKEKFSENFDINVTTANTFIDPKTGDIEHILYDGTLIRIPGDKETLEVAQNFDFHSIKEAPSMETFMGKVETGKEALESLDLGGAEEEIVENVIDTVMDLF